MEMFWDWCLKSPPLCFLRSSYIYFWRWISVWTLWHWNGTEKFPIFLNTSYVALSVVGGPFVSMFLNILLPRNSDRIQKLVAPYILNQTAQISRGEYFWSFFCEIIGSKLLVKKTVSSLPILAKWFEHSQHESQRGLVVWAKYFGISYARGHRFRTAVSKAWETFGREDCNGKAHAQ